MLNNFNMGACPSFLGFDQHLPAKCSVFSLLFGAEYYRSLEIALTNVG
jgi:hypothetical protein